MNDGFPPIRQLASLLEGLAGSGSADLDPAISTGFEKLDGALAGGIRAGQLTLIAGIAGVGKSTFALGLALNAAIRQQLRTLIIAPQSSEHEILVRVLAAEARVGVSHLRSGHLDESDREKVDRHRQALTSAPILIDAAWSVESTTDKLLNLAGAWMSEGVRFLVVDDTAGAEPRTRDLMKGLKTLAQKHRAAVVVVTHAVVPRHRHGARPILEDLRDYEEIADLIDTAMMLHRADMHDWDASHPGEADIDIIKQRHGPSRRITLAFQGHYARFVDMVLLASCRRPLASPPHVVGHTAALDVRISRCAPDRSNASGKAHRSTSRYRRTTRRPEDAPGAGTQVALRLQPEVR